MTPNLFDEIVHQHATNIACLSDLVRDDFGRALQLLSETLSSGHKILLCGNGGSAADAQHFAAELVSGRPPLRALSLTVDTSALTALANDFGYGTVFAKQVLAMGEARDVLIAISTSGKSKSILAAAEAARDQGLSVVGLTGPAPCPLQALSDVCIHVPGQNTQRIQEMHILVLHAWWESLAAWT